MRYSVSSIKRIYLPLIYWTFFVCLAALTVQILKMGKISSMLLGGLMGLAGFYVGLWRADYLETTYKF